MTPSKIRLTVILLSTILISSCSLFKVADEQYYLEISNDYSNAYTNKELSYSLFPNSKLDSIKIDPIKKEINIFFDKRFSFIPFRNNNVDSIYHETNNFFSDYLEGFETNIYCMDQDLYGLIPNFFRGTNLEIDSSRIPIRAKIKNPIVYNLSKNLKAEKGLYNRNVALWHSHGWYYNHRLDRWLWQRARLFQTVEDLGPFSFTVPYIVPMLENAGANVFLPRERDIQKSEVILDNTNPSVNIIGNWNIDTSTGFRMDSASIPANANPFEQGNYLVAEAEADQIYSVEYIPSIPEAGEYSLNISYQSLELSSSDVLYSVYHSGGRTDFSVNQQIGGSTWIHLGKFKFESGINPNKAKVVVSTENSVSGELVTTDAVRFGGGYGVVERNGAASGKPKFIEGARYYMQFAGMPDTLVYNINENENDYKDDYQGRGEWVNYLVGNPSGPNLKRDVKGLGIPIDVSIAFHTDAGISESDTTIGTLMIYSLSGMDTANVFPLGYTRMANRDFADIAQTQIVDDIRKKYDPVWRRRGLREAQYSESTRPNVPSLLLELASHQNFLDARFMSDPRFKFDVSRSIYKSVLKFLSIENNFEYVVQPLPVTHFAIEKKGNSSIKLSWEPQNDPLEPSAIADRYILYTSIDGDGFDNGIIVNKPWIQLDDLENDKIYNFKITAINQGGESFPSEILSCYLNGSNDEIILIVNGFDRIAPPAYVDSEQYSGFLNNIDQGVPYIMDIGFTGNQHNFSPQSTWKSDDIPGHGASYANYETKIIAGNTFDYPLVHGEAIKASGHSFISMSDEAFTNTEFSMNGIKFVDLIMGEEKTTQWTKPYTDSLLGLQFEIFSDDLMERLDQYLNRGGKLFISGSYIGSDPVLGHNSSEQKVKFITEKLKYKLSADHAVVNGDLVSISEEFLSTDITDFNFITNLNDSIYNAEAPDALSPVNGSKTLMRYKENFFSAGIGYKGDYSIIAFGFPFETIKGYNNRVRLMSAILNFFDEE